jgi:uncharacterized protein YvpB
MVWIALIPSVTARASNVAQSGGVVLDGWGGLHTFGGATVDMQGAPYWPGWDIARAVNVIEDGSGGWTLDGWGGIHAWGSAPSIPTPAYWPGRDIARDFVTYSRDSNGFLNGSEGYLLDGGGGIHPWGGAPALTGYPSQTTDLARSLLLHFDSHGSPDGGWTLWVDGSLHAFGAAVGAPAPLTLAHDDVWQKVRAVGSENYAVAMWGKVVATGGLTPNWSGYSDWGSWDILRDIALYPVQTGTSTPQPISTASAGVFAATQRPHLGVVLDGWGGVHPVGGTPVNTSGAPYWAGWDIARSVVVREDGSGGWTLDGWGGIHAWGSAPSASTPAYWSGWDIARAMVMTSHDGNGVTDGAQGYLLDGWGGIHPWGGAPDIGSPPYQSGFDIYRGLTIHYDARGNPDGGWAMDDVGQTYAFGNAPALGNVSPDAMRPMFHSLHATDYGYYAVARDGKISTFGSGFVSPYWDNWIDWGSWDIVRDIDLVNPVNPDHPVQPLSTDAANDYTAHVSGRYTMWAPQYKQSHSLDCEAASMQIALAARGTAVSQDWELAYWGADLLHSVRDGAGNIMQWGDPYQTFVGNVNASEWNATGYGVYYPPLVNLANATGHNAIGKQGWDPQELMALVASGYPAAIEISYNMQGASPRNWTAWDGRTVPYILNDHVVTMIGVDYGRQTVIVNDPYSGTQKEFSWNDFYRSFSYLGNMATVIS